MLGPYQIPDQGAADPATTVGASASLERTISQITSRHCFGKTDKGDLKQSKGIADTGLCSVGDFGPVQKLVLWLLFIYHYRHGQ